MTNNTTTPELIEKVARAIDATYKNARFGQVGPDWRWFIPEAKAAIAALAEHQSAPEQDRPETAVESPAKAQTATNTAGEPVSGKLPTDTPDKFIAEALRLAGLAPLYADVVREGVTADYRDSRECKSILAHAATLHKLAVAREALAFYALPSCGGFPDNFAYQALAQIGRADTSTASSTSQETQ